MIIIAIINILHMICVSCEPEAKFRLKKKGKVVNVNIPPLGRYIQFNGRYYHTVFTDIVMT